jgi:Tfp pilus assembly protein PilW
MGDAVSGRAGFSVLEVLVAAASSLLILAAVGGFARAESRMVERESRRLRAREANRRVVAMIAREIRGAGFAPVAGGFDGASEGLAVAARARLEIRSDLHGTTSGDPPDGVLDPDSDERVGFSSSSSRGIISQSMGRQTMPLTLESMVPQDGLVIRYFDSCGSELVPPTGGELSPAERATVRAVTVRLTVVEDTETVTSEARAALRNRETLRCG